MIRMISFPDGMRMNWEDYRGVMQGTISPQAAVDRARRSPAGAYDAAPRKGRAHAWDQGEPTKGGGKLDGPYCRATDAYLRAHDVDPKDVATIMAILEKNQAAETGEDMTTLPMTLGTVTRGGAGKNDLPGFPSGRLPDGSPAPSGAQDAFTRPWAFDSYGGRLSPTPPLTRDFAARFPGAAKIRVL